jgi:hypothetical protein
MITEQSIFDVITKLVQFPQSTICKHYAALQVLQILPEEQICARRDLVKALVDANDEEALEILQRNGK